MEILIEELIRGLGYVALWLVSAGRYRGGSAGYRLREVALGLVLVGLGVYATYALAAA